MKGPGEGFAELARIVRETARRHGLRHGYDSLGESVIPGKRGFLYLGGDQWHWALVPEGGVAPWSGRLLSNAKGDPRLELLVEGDAEAIFRLRSEEDLRDVAVRWCQCRKRRQLTEEQRAKAIENLRAPRLRGLKRSQNARSPIPATQTT